MINLIAKLILVGISQILTEVVEKKRKGGRQRQRIKHSDLKQIEISLQWASSFLH